jgi:hypothetical protein
MRYSIYINQVKALEWGLNYQQAALFNCLYELQAWARCEILDGQPFYWAAKNKIIEEIPLVFDKPDTLKRHIIALENAGLIEKRLHRNMPFIRITEKGKEWNSAGQNEAVKNITTQQEESCKKSRPSREKNHDQAVKKITTIIKPDQNTKILKEKSKPKKSEFDFSSWPEKPSEQVLADWMKVRKEQRAPLTQTAITRMAGELQQAHAGGMSVDDCIGLAAEKGWRGFKYQWALNALGDNRNFGNGSRGQGSDGIDWDDNSWADGLVIQFPASGGKP